MAILDTFTINKTAKVEVNKIFLKIAIAEADKISQEKINLLVLVVANEFSVVLANANVTQEQIDTAVNYLAYIMRYLE